MATRTSASEDARIEKVHAWLWRAAVVAPPREKKVHERSETAVQRRREKSLKRAVDREAAKVATAATTSAAAGRDVAQASSTDGMLGQAAAQVAEAADPAAGSEINRLRHQLKQTTNLLRTTRKKASRDIGLAKRRGAQKERKEQKLRVQSKGKLSKKARKKEARALRTGISQRRKREQRQQQQERQSQAQAGFLASPHLHNLTPPPPPTGSSATPRLQHLTPLPPPRHGQPPPPPRQAAPPPPQPRQHAGGQFMGGSSSAHSLGADVRPGDWRCPACDVNVFGSKVACFRCGAARPGAAKPGGRGGRGGGRGGRGGMPAAAGAGGRAGGDVRPGDWSCPGCHSNVFASKRSCFKCGTAKP